MGQDYVVVWVAGQIFFKQDTGRFEGGGGKMMCKWVLEIHPSGDLA